MDTIRTVKVEQLESTQVLARRLALEDRASLPLVVVAARQSAGVGRLGRPWASPAGGLWFTLGVERPAALGILQAGAGIACGEIIRSVLATLPGEQACSLSQSPPLSRTSPRHPPLIKWPNDLLIDGRKVGGVLIETIARPGGDTIVLCGVGLNTNVSPEDLPPDLVHGVATLQEWLGRPVNNDELMQTLVERVLPLLDGRADMAGVILSAGSHLHCRDAEATITLADERRVQGVIRGLTSEGALMLDTSSGAMEVHSGEVGS